MARKPNLLPEERAAIIAMRRANPNMPLRVIGDRYGVTPACVCMVIQRGPEPEPAKVVMRLPPAPSPHMSWTPDPRRLMAGK